MWQRAQFATIPGVLAGWLSLAGSASALAPAVLDHAHVFSAPALEQANQDLADIQARYHVPLVIETFAHVPRLARWVHNLNNSTVRDKYFEDWARRKAREAANHGIYVLVCREPAPWQVQVVVAERLADECFPAADRTHLQGELTNMLRTGRADAGLLDAVHFAMDTLDSRGAAGVAPEPFPWGGILTSITVLLGIWLGGQVNQAIRPARYSSAARGDGGLFPDTEASLPAMWFVAASGGWLAPLLRRATLHPADEDPAQAETETFPPLDEGPPAHDLLPTREGPHYQVAGQQGSAYGHE
jgi:hypothetical protein